MGKYDHLNSVERVRLAHQLLDDATLVLKNLHTNELGDVDIETIGRYLGGYQEAFNASHRFIAKLKQLGIITDDNPYSAPALPEQFKGKVPF